MKYVLYRLFVSFPAFVSRMMATTPVLIVNTVIGSAIAAYYKVIISDVVSWMIPCFFVIVFDLVWGIKAAIRRKERVTFTSAVRRTLSKIFSYACWTVFAVAVGHNTENARITWYVMFIILVIEGMSCIENMMEYHGWGLKSSGIVAMIGRLISKWLGIPVEGSEIVNIRGCGHSPENKESETTTDNNKEE